jgi:hypothetical protein
MTIRTTVAFDPPTAARLEWLAKRWGISKSETLRRTLRTAELQELEKSAPPEESGVPDPETMTPSEILDWLECHPLLSAEEGEHMRRERRRLRDEVGRRGESRKTGPSPETTP